MRRIIKFRKERMEEVTGYWMAISSTVTLQCKIVSGNETVEKLTSERLMENVHMQGFQNRGPARRVGSPSGARTNPEESPPKGGICERRT
jgi:hypothetical protein